MIIYLGEFILYVKKRTGHLQVDIDPNIYSKLKKKAKERGKSVDDLAKEIFLKSIKSQKRRKKTK